IAVGTLFRDEFSMLDRDTFEALLAGLARAQLLEIHDDAFEKDGRRIAFQRLSLAGKGCRAQRGPIAAQIPAAFVAPAPTKKTVRRFARRRTTTKRARAACD